MTAQIACVHCATRAEYEAEQLRLSLVCTGEGIQILNFDCSQCGGFNAQSIGEQLAECLTDMGTTTSVVGPISELEENLILRTGPALNKGYVDTFASMSIGSFNRLLERDMEAGLT